MVPYEVDEISNRAGSPSVVVRLSPGVLSWTSTVNLPARSSSVGMNWVAVPFAWICRTGMASALMPAFSDSTNWTVTATGSVLPIRTGIGLFDEASVIGGPGGLIVTWL